MCNHEGCKKKSFANGLCHSHYDAERLANALACSVAGCGLPSHAKGLCGLHYRRELRARTERPFCSIDGCKDYIHANGLCTKHHTRLRRHGSLKPVRPKTFNGTEKQYEDHYRRMASQTLMRKYGITLHDYEIMYEAQDGKCLICEKRETRINSFTGEPIRMPVDHCHETGEIRGLLCSCCNTALGNFEDSIDTLNKAIAYLKKFKRPKLKSVKN